jgi:predicted RNase H-like nuclease (RuvC/YqgF family)
MQMYDTSVPVEGAKDISFPKFYVEAIENKEKTAEAGRPVFDEREMVRIVIPGDKLLEVVSNVTERHRRRWPEQYKRWKQGLEEPLSGTPLSQWPILPRSRVEELTAMGIRTVEALADLADGNIPKRSGIQELKNKARLWLEKSKDNSVLTRLQKQSEDQEKENERLKQQLAELSAQVAKLSEK